MNNLTISHDDPAKVQEFADAYNSGQTCEHYLPVPKEYYEDNGAFPKWYDYCVNTWGTKWDIGKEEYEDPAIVEDDEVGVSFNSAWSPPIQFYEKLVELGYDVRASYWEPGMAFCGIWDNGIDNYIEYGDMEKEEVIPVALWNEYGMADFFEEMA